MYVVEDRADFLALYVPAGAPIGFAPPPLPTVTGRHAWDRGPDTVWEGEGVLHLHRPGDHHSIWVFWGGPDRSHVCWYVNLQAAFERTPIGIDTLDYELDIVVDPSGHPWTFKDMDRMDGLVERGRMTRTEADLVILEGHRIGGLLDAGERWWSDEWAAWNPPPEMLRPGSLPPGWDRLHLR